MYELQRATPDKSMMSATLLSPEQKARAEKVASIIQALNYVIEQAVDAGLTVELARTRRSHGPDGAWGDQITAQVTVSDSPTRKC